VTPAFHIIRSPKSRIRNPESVPLSGADLTRREEAALLRVLRSGRLALGPEAERFEREAARYIGVRHAVATSSGTTALHLIVRALGLGPGDEVITTPFSFVASANCLLYERVTPVFADVEPRTFNLDPAQVERRITPRTRAILAVDVFGCPADWPSLRRIARKHGLALIEDSCEALGAQLGNRRCGSFGHAAVLAFYPNKQITTGEGGMVLTDSKRLADLCRSMANQGRAAASGRWLEHVRLGYNYRLDELSAALGRVQLARIATILRRRDRVARQYQRLLTDVPGLRLPNPEPGTGNRESGILPSWFVYVVLLDQTRNAAARNRVLARLRGAGVQCSDYFRPIHLQPFYRSSFGYRRGQFPVAEAVGDHTVALPFHGRMTAHQLRYVARALKTALTRNDRRRLEYGRERPIGHFRISAATGGTTDGQPQ